MGSKLWSAKLKMHHSIPSWTRRRILQIILCWSVPWVFRSAKVAENACEPRAALVGPHGLQVVVCETQNSSIYTKLNLSQNVVIVFMLSSPMHMSFSLCQSCWESLWASLRPCRSWNATSWCLQNSKCINLHQTGSFAENWLHDDKSHEFFALPKLLRTLVSLRQLF